MHPVFSLGEAAEAAGGVLISGDPLRNVAGLSIDSRAVKEGDLFIALEGERTDGHLFVKAAASRGAAGAVVNRVLDTGLSPEFGLITVEDTVRALGGLGSYHLRALPNLIKIGVTGSLGKTSTKEMIRCILSKRFRAIASDANYNTEIGVPLTAFKAKRDDEVAVFEMAMRGKGQIRWLCEIVNPQIGVITNIGPTHMELLGSEEAIAEAKGELLECLPSEGLAVLNLDDPWSNKISSRFLGKKAFFSLDPSRVLNVKEKTAGDVRLLTAASMESSEDEVCFDLVVPGERSSRIALKSPGVHSVSNALAAALVGMEMGMTIEQISDGLREFRPGPMRLEIVRASDSALTIIDDAYNASPASMKAALDVLSGFKGKRKIAVLGDMLELGGHERTGHIEVGEAAARSEVDILILVGPRARLMKEAACKSSEKRPKVFICRDNKAACDVLRQEVRREDAVLVKGSRAMRMDQIVRRLKEMTI